MAREKILWNKGWKFLHGDWIAGMKPEFDDKKWYDICLPHSFGIPYFMENEFYVGYGCYRKHVTMKREWLGKRISLEFQGVFHLSRQSESGGAQPAYFFFKHGGVPSDRLSRGLHHRAMQTEKQGGVTPAFHRSHVGKLRSADQRA